MNLSILDWIIIGSFFVLSLIIGLSFRKRAGKSLADYFLGGRKLPWFIAGISMVATTFAADTPLAVTELVANNGISGNWLWWNMLIGGMLTTFFFAKLWRRANILTELELIEIRYSGKAAAFLRGFKSLYMVLFMNTIIIGWINVALMSIIKVFFNIPDDQLMWYLIFALTITVIYSTISGLWGVAITDSVQFIIAMTGCIILAIFVLKSPEIGGIMGLKAKLPEGALQFFPKISIHQPILHTSKTLVITIGAFLSFVFIQWWASWYPGAEPGGGGYIAQRMMSAKNEKHSVFATLFFQIAHYCIRPWPWILVALASVVLYPELSPEDKRMGFVMIMRDYLPSGLKGLLLVAFLAAYMSSVSSQLNWGSSYLVNDFYKRFIKPESSFESPEKAQKRYVLMGRIFTVFIMLFSLIATTQIKTISGVWEFIIECGAGLGLVLILRWYWWRINAWSEITATISPFIGFAIAKLILEKNLPQAFIDNRGSFFFTVAFATVSWLTVTFLTQPTDKNKLREFYKRVNPDGFWKPVRTELGITYHKSQIGNLLVCWISSILMTYSILFFTGDIIFMNWLSATIWGATSIASFFILRMFIYKTNIFE